MGDSTANDVTRESQGALFLMPLVNFEAVSLLDANRFLVAWQHKMGPLQRGNQGAWCHALFHEGRPIAVTTASHLISARVGNAPWLTRENTVELSRLCAERSGLCREDPRKWPLTDPERIECIRVWYAAALNIRTTESAK